MLQNVNCLNGIYSITEAEDIKTRQSRRVSFGDYVLEKRQRKSMRMLKVEYEEALATIEDLQAENDALHKSIEEYGAVEWYE